MKHTLLAIITAAALLTGCTSTVSKNVRADGSVGELVWPTQKDSWRKEPLRLPSPTIAAVKVGLERANVFTLLDVPHFSEINGAREWNYILQRPEYTRENQAVCHLKLIYGDDDRIAAQYWSPEDCATVYDAPPAAWLWALQEVIASRDSGKLTLSLKSHGYLYEVISNYRPAAVSVVTPAAPADAAPAASSKTGAAVSALAGMLRK